MIIDLCAFRLFIPYVPISEEPVETLESNLLLYKAARVGNLGVMCEALALGADKNWSNPNDEGSTPLHQAVSGVRGAS